jgi:hypothetical protein
MMALFHDRQNLHVQLSCIGAMQVEVEVDLASGFPGFSTVGLPGNIVK